MNSSQSSKPDTRGEFSALSLELRDLPTLSPVVERIRALIARENCSAQDIVGALKLDPVISGKVLKLANSAYIGIPRTVSSLQNAVVLLGQKRILSLVTVSQVLNTFSALKTESAFSFTSFWRHSITTAMIAESIARHVSGSAGVEADEVFSAGILHDIGKLVLGWYDGEQLSGYVRTCADSPTPFFRLEPKKGGHWLIGGAILDKWNFPGDLTAAVRNHHDPSGQGNGDPLCSIVHLSDIAAHILGFQTVAGEAIPAFDSAAVDRLQLPAERLKVIAQEVLADQQRIDSIFGVL